MSSYTITIAADDPNHATTTLKVEVSDATPRITELVVRAGQANGLTAGQIPAVDLDLLLRAVAPAADGRQAITTPPIAVSDDVPAAGDMRVDDGKPLADPTAGQAAETPTAADEPATTSPTDGAGDVVVPKQVSAATKASEVKKASRSSGAGATRSQGGKGKAVAGGKATSTATKRTAKGGASAGEGRVYRRSPGDLEAVYEQAGSVAAVADHYNVPRHTAQGWIRTLRRRQAERVSE